MKLFFRIIFKICLILAILIGCEITEEEKETVSDELLNQGIAFRKEGQYNQAIAYFNKAIDINPRSAKAYYNRGRSYFRERRYNKAIADFSKAIEINPRHGYAYTSRGVGPS